MIEAYIFKLNEGIVQRGIPFLIKKSYICNILKSKTMAAPKKNHFWELRKTHGTEKKYTPDEVWDKFIEYQQWVQDNPLHEEKVFMYKGEIVTHSMDKMRAMTQQEFRLFAEISDGTWDNYAKDKDYLSIVNEIKHFIFVQKFTGAAADLLNHNIIARELNLYDSVKNVDNRPAVHVHTNSPDEIKKLSKGQ